MTAVYSLKNLKKKYGDRAVLDVPELTIEGNRIYALLGPNGAGKTTLLNILAFLEEPSSGTLQFQGQPVRFSASELHALRRGVVMVDQHPILFTTTVYKNVEFGLKIRNIPRAERARIIDEALEMVGMQAFADEPAHLLSGGETQRVALARGLALSPSVLLCDEPTSSVDVENQAIIVNFLRQINETKKMTIILTTHDRAQSAALAHHTLMLDHGKLIKAGYDNIFSVTIDCRNGEPQTCSPHPNVSLHLPGQVPNGNRMRIFIDPNQIKVVDKDSAESGKNVIRGAVRQVMAENSHIRLVVESDIWLNLFMSIDDYQDRKIMVGQHVHCIIPPEAIHIIG